MHLGVLLLKNPLDQLYFHGLKGGVGLVVWKDTVLF